MHLSYLDLVDRVRGAYLKNNAAILKEFGLKERDEAFFYSVPSSFFAMNDEIPKRLRELLAEAEGCLKSNFLTGASVCIRKAIYELAVLQEASGENYEERIKSLGKKTRYRRNLF